MLSSHLTSVRCDIEKGFIICRVILSVVESSHLVLSKKTLTVACSFGVSVWVYSLISSLFPHICVCVSQIKKKKKTKNEFQTLTSTSSLQLHRHRSAYRVPDQQHYEKRKSKGKRKNRTLFVFCNSENWETLFVLCNNRQFRSDLENNLEGRDFFPLFLFSIQLPFIGFWKDYIFP